MGTVVYWLAALMKNGKSKDIKTAINK